MTRRKVIKFVSEVGSRTRVTRVVDRVNRRRGGVILVFHEIGADVLAKHLAQIAEMYTFVSLDEFVDRLAAGKSTVGLAAITFDDGLDAEIEAAATIARQHSWPMTFFLPTRFLDNLEPYWFLEIDQLLSGALKRPLLFNGQSFELDSPKAIGDASSVLRQHFKTLPTVDAVDSTLRRIRLSLFGSEQRPSGLSLPRPIPWERVRQLAVRPELFFECHTVNHLAVSRLTETGLRAELETSRARIQEITNRPVQHFCYPYGSPNEVGRSAPETVRKLFRSGTTTSRGRCAAGVDMALLPRVPIDGADSEEVAALKVSTAR